MDSIASVGSTSSQIINSETVMTPGRGRRVADENVAISLLSSLSPTSLAAIVVSILVLVLGGVYFASGSNSTHTTVGPGYIAASEGTAAYILFLEHMVASLLKNVTHPASFVKQEERYFKASRELESQLQQLSTFTGELSSQMKAARLAREDLDQLISENSDAPPEPDRGDPRLLEFFRSRNPAYAANSAPIKPALSQAIRSSPWYIYLAYVFGSLLIATAIALAVLKFSGVSPPFHIPIVSELL